MDLVAEIAGSQHRIVDCVRLASVWIASIDHEFSEREASAILKRLPDRPGGVPLLRIAEYVRLANENERYDGLVPIFGLIRDTLSESSRDGFLRLVVDIAAADRRVSIGERHAMMFLADLVGRSHLLAACFEDVMGMPFSLPADLSDPAYWDELERASQREREKARSQGESQSSAGKPQGPRVDALATLGLVGEPTDDEIRAAYRRLTRVHHPDRYHGLDDEAIGHATRAFQRIQAAYQLLLKGG